jgi:nucleoid-associated protein EbfC
MSAGSSGDMGNLLKQAQEMKRELDRAREELRTTVVSGTGGAGLVRVDATGDGSVVRISIKPEALQGGDARRVEEWVLTATQDALERARRTREERMARVTGGLNLPEIF